MKKPALPVATPQPRSSASRTPAPRAANLDRHARKCAVCNHPQREEIEDDFLGWCEPAGIAEEYELPSRSTLYHHAHATGLMARRRQNLRIVAERILECVGTAEVNGNTVLRAMRIYAHITDDGEWIEPPRESLVTHIHKFERPEPQREALPSKPAQQPESRSAENKELSVSANEILIATPNVSRRESSD